MTRFINAALIVLFAFFVTFAVVLQFTGDGGPGAAQPGGAPTVSGVEATWRPERQEMVLDLQVHNPSSLETRVSAVSYQAQVEGDLVDSAVARPVSGVLLPSKDDGSVQVAVALPDGFVLDWWPTYMADAEAAELRIQGELRVVRDDGDRDVPFEWRSSWQGSLASGLTEAVANCGAGETDLCLKASRFFWKEGALHADLEFHNPGADAVALRNTTLQLLFADRAVVAGDVDVAQRIAAGGDEEIGLALTFSPAAMEAWWPEHLSRCERTPVAFRMALQVESLPAGDGAEEPAPDIANLQWTFPAPAFQTRFVCSP
jgi:LEA14-like dessication related protein